MFGQFIKKRRIALDITLREYCRQNGEDPSNWSRMERGILKAPTDRSRLDQIARSLRIPANGEAEREFLDLAAADRGRIPDDILKDEELVKHLPLVFRTIRGETPSEDQLLKLAESIRRDLSGAE